jgi:hypothetical protein
MRVTWSWVSLMTAIFIPLFSRPDGSRGRRRSQRFRPASVPPGRENPSCISGKNAL